MLFGAAASVGLQLALGTWDAPWRQSVLGWSVAVVLVALTVLLAVLARRDDPPGPARAVRGLWVLGAGSALVVLLLLTMPLRPAAEAAG